MPLAVILTTLQVEYLSIRKHLIDLKEETHPQGTLYERGHFVIDNQLWEVGIAQIGIGNSGTASETERALNHFNPDVLFLVGIASGIKKVKVGDVVAATKVYGYEAGKAGKNKFATWPALGQSTYSVVQRARSEARKDEWLERIDSDVSDSPAVFVEPIAAGEKVIASPESETLQLLQTNYNDAIAVEMEGYGCLKASFAYPEIQTLVIRGIYELIENIDSDNLVEVNEASQQKQAADNASAFAFEVLSKLEVGNEQSTESEKDTFERNLAYLESLWQDKIPAWLNNRDGLDIEHLKEIVALCKKVENATNSKDYWREEFLSHKVVHDYLSYLRYNNEFNHEIKNLMHQILTSDDSITIDDYTRYKDIFDWLNKPEENVNLIDVAIQDINGLIEVIYQLKLLMVKDNVDRDTTKFSEEITAKCQKYLLSAILNLRFELSRQDDDGLGGTSFLISLLSLGYDPSLNTFQKDLKFEDYQELIDVLQEDNNQFLSKLYIEESRERLEAHFLLKVLNLPALNFENKKEEILKFIHSTFRPKLTSVVLVNILSRYNVDLPYECKKACKEIELILSSQQSALATDDVLDVNLDVSQETLQEDALSKGLISLVAPETLKPMMNDLLNKLGLSQYYPNKLGREEVYTLTKYSLAESPSCEPEKLSLYFLTNLLSLNHQARWIKVYRQGDEFLDNEEEGWIEEDESSESEEECWIEENDDTESVSKDIHPLDVMIATLLCCHPIIHQDLVVKLWECKLAIPLVIQESEEQAPKFFLWAMRALVMRWKKIKGKQQFRSEERTIADYPMETVSFIRLDRSEISKSALLNAIILGNNPHDIFFHKDSEGSNNHRQIVEGTVELAWYLPEGNLSPDDSSVQNNFRLDDITAFANLRGDARKYPKQLKLVKYISSHVVIFASAKELSSTVSLVQELLSAGKAVILLLTNKIVEKSDSQLVKDWKKNFYREHELKQISLIKIAGKSQPQIRDEVRRRLKTLKPTTDSKISLENLAEVMHQEGMKVDEYDNDCQRGIEQAEKVLELVRQHSSEERKAKLLPLQSKSWKDWADADKEMVRQKRKPSTESSGEYAKKQNARCAHSRNQQIKLVQQERLPKVIKFLCSNLLQNESRVNEFFIRQLKLQLDMLSRIELPELYSAYGEKMKLLGQYQTVPSFDGPDTTEAGAQRKQEMHARKIINQELQLIDAEITAQSFGLEHLLREIGQVYLALKGMEPYGEKSEHTPCRSQEQEQWYQELPKAVAELLLSGYPLEIMDGEVSSVPLEWVQAVLKAFTQVVQQQEQNVYDVYTPRIFALSAMGIQSSGKSTLLNVMFGLQFAVSAGRCTKGIYLQPIKLDSELQEQLNADYIFVLDTEGIKSSEQSLDSDTSHDNELSTFVIGLSDLTLIKVSGENSEYLKDILPISVQAFLRMRQVALKPKTKIIHRNVDTSSSEKLNKQNVHLNNTLDKYTALACREENQPVRPFCDIIDFDLRKDVEYLGALYKGTATRNPVDPDYSKSVKGVASEIVDGINRDSISSINKFIGHFEDLWNAVKKDDFVYEFKNTIQIQARGILNKFWREIVQKSSEDIAKLVNLSYREIRSCRSESAVDEKTTQYEENLLSLIQEIWRTQKENIDQFFEEQDGHYENAMKKWEASTINDLEEWLSDRKRSSLQQIQSYQASRLAALKRIKKSVGYKEKFTQRITKYVKQKKQNENVAKLIDAKEPELHREFQLLWADLLSEIESPRLKSAKVELDVENLLSERYPKIYNLITQRKKTKSFTACPIEDFKVSDEYYSSIRLQEVINAFNMNDVLKIEQQIDELKTSLLKELSQKLDQAERELTPYNQNFLILTRLLFKANDQFNKKSESLKGLLNVVGFSLTRECKADLFMIICGEAIRRLKRIDELWLKEQNPVLMMDKERESYWQLFLTMFQSANLQQAVVEILLEIIQEGISKRIENDLPTEISNMRQVPKYSKLFKNKQSLIASIMVDLAKYENFEDYLEYIQYPETAFRKWFSGYIDSYNRDGKVREIIENEVDISVKQALSILKDTNKSIQNSSAQSYSILSWLDKFLEIKGPDLIIENLERIERLAEQFPKEDFMFPDSEINQSLDRVKHNLLNSIELNELSKNTSNQYQKIRSQVIEKFFNDDLGCIESCPFCGEICMLGAKNHSGILHATTHNIHRPQGLTGFRDNNTQRLTTESCSQLLAGSYRFKNYDTDYNWKPYEDYQDVYPTWDIKGDFSLKVEDYWRWVMYKYRTEFAKEYSAKEADIPADWKLITKDQATEKLRQIIDGQR